MHARTAARLIIRAARADDEDALLRIDQVTWSPHVTPAPSPPAGPFFKESTQLDNVVVAELDGRVVGYAKMRHPTELPASEHVWECNGLAVDPECEGRGAGRALIEALIARARERGGLKFTLRVFAPNARARRLYEALGFQTEGILRGEFRVADGELVDDHLMALDLTA